jgi:hypothetical protein
MDKNKKHLPCGSVCAALVSALSHSAVSLPLIVTVDAYAAEISRASMRFDKFSVNVAVAFPCVKRKRYL